MPLMMNIITITMVMFMVVVCAQSDRSSLSASSSVQTISVPNALPPSLLADLSYDRAENTDFFAVGPFRGTPLRTLPALDNFRNWLIQNAAG